jgi:DNA ligase D-like protein (predicted 3'-phosphoesterase)
MPIFVVHEHAARRLHWDLRLEINGVLKSWAVPKEPPLAKGAKRLAIAVEDHPLSYANFEGVIAEGYGKGTVKIWDSGTYEIKEMTKNKIEVTLKGKKLKGTYVILKFGKEEKNWLFFKL